MQSWYFDTHVYLTSTKRMFTLYRYVTPEKKSAQLRQALGRLNLYIWFTKLLKDLI